MGEEMSVEEMSNFLNTEIKQQKVPIHIYLQFSENDNMIRIDEYCMNVGVCGQQWWNRAAPLCLRPVGPDGERWRLTSATFNESGRGYEQLQSADLSKSADLISDGVVSCTLRAIHRCNINNTSPN